MQGWVRVSRNHFTGSLKKEAHTLTTPLSLYSDADELNRSSNNLNMTSRCSKHWKVAVAAPSQSQSIPIAGISRSQSELEDLAHAELLADYRDGQMYERISKLFTCISTILYYAALIISKPSPRLFNLSYFSERYLAALWWDGHLSPQNSHVTEQYHTHQDARLRKYLWKQKKSACRWGLVYWRYIWAHPFPSGTRTDEAQRTLSFTLFFRKRDSRWFYIVSVLFLNNINQ